MSTYDHWTSSIPVAFKNIFPKNILVGKIISISDEKLIALPFVDLKNLEFVQIISKN